MGQSRYNDIIHTNPCIFFFANRYKMFPLKLFLFASSDFSNLCLQRFINEKFLSRAKLLPEGVGGGALPYMGYKGICGPKGYGFLAVLV